MTNQEIITRGELIRDETVTGANTAQRVGEAFVAIGENLEEVKDITANQQESISDINGKRTFAFNFGKGQKNTYSSLFFNYHFKAGHNYRLSILTNTIYTTYFSLRDASGNIVDAQTNIGYVVGSYSVDMECSADAERLYLTVKEAMAATEDDKLFDVSVLDLSMPSLQSLDVRLNSVENGISFSGLGTSTSVIVPLGKLVSGRIYSLSLVGGSTLDINYLKITSIQGGNQEDLQYFTSNYVIECPLFFPVPANSESIILTVRATLGVEMSVFVEDVTSILKTNSWAKLPMFEFGTIYSDNGEDKYALSNSLIRTKRYYKLHLQKGDKVGLTSYEDFKLQVIQLNEETNGTYSAWLESSYYNIGNDGDYVFKIAPKIDGTTFDSSASIASLFWLQNAGDGDIFKNVLGMENHGENPDITFERRGTFVQNDGTVGISQNWKTTLPFRLYKNETVFINCSTTSSIAPILIKVNGNHDVFPSQEASYTPVVFGGNSIEPHFYTAKEDCFVMLQYYRITGSPYIYPDSGRLIDIESRLGKIENGGVNIPDYYVEESDRIYRELRARTNGKSLVFAFHTDQHISASLKGTGNNEDPTYTMRGIMSLVGIAKRIPVDLVVFGGDVAGYNKSYQGVNDIIDDINIINKPFADINTPCVSIPGNHDAFQNNRDVTAEAMYNSHYKRCKWIKGMHYGSDNCSMYYDDTDKNIRFIFLDTFTQNGRAGVRAYVKIGDSDNQSDINADIKNVCIEFLTNQDHGALSTMESNYKAIIFSHNPLTSEFNSILKYKDEEGTTDKSIFADSTDIHTILDTYCNKIIACICGHEHTDSWGISGSGILYVSVSTSAPYTSNTRLFKVEKGDNEHYFLPYARTKDTINETAFDIFVVNTSDETIETLRFGQGTNRKWKYGNDAGLIGYRNCVSGKVSIPSLTLTFTESEDGQPISGGDVISVQCDADGRFEAYLKLATEYNISSDGHTLDTTYVEVNENVNLGYINIS